jgi:hypothetical protein
MAEMIHEARASHSTAVLTSTTAFVRTWAIHVAIGKATRSSSRRPTSTASSDRPDPKTYTRPFTISIPDTSPPGYQVLPYECHEGNLAILQALGGERAEDKALDDAKKGITRPRRPIQGGLTVGGQPIPESGLPASNP